MVFRLLFHKLGIWLSNLHHLLHNIEPPDPTIHPLPNYPSFARLSVDNSPRDSIPHGRVVRPVQYGLSKRVGKLPYLA